MPYLPGLPSRIAQNCPNLEQTSSTDRQADRTIRTRLRPRQRTTPCSIRKQWRRLEKETGWTMPERLRIAHRNSPLNESSSVRTDYLRTTTGFIGQNGISLNGAVVQADRSGDKAVYGSNVTRQETLDGKVAAPISRRGACWRSLPSTQHAVEIGRPPQRASLATAGIAMMVEPPTRRRLTPVWTPRVLELYDLLGPKRHESLKIAIDRASASR